MEQSFARGTQYGFDRARCRGLWRVQIQEYLISAIQNLQVGLKYGNQPKKSLAALVNQVKRTVRGAITFASDIRGNLLNAENNPRLSVEGFIFGYTGS
ncbi:MAG: hypothetical protein ABSB22_23505 [Thermodesulfobacteriota bacterium]|jgi:hypothetical protein